MSDTQFGFRKDRGTVDCMFILHGVIELLIAKSKPLYCAFIDMKRAFDSVHRRALWFKLHESGVSTKIILLLKNMYSKIKLCVKNTCNRRQENINDYGDKDEVYSHFFTSIAGVFQGESLSPFLFSMFINDINDVLCSNDDVGAYLFDWLLTILLFADDMALLSESRDGLQKGLDKLGEYCEKWGLIVNINKTQCVAFKKGGRMGKMDKWTYRNEPLETVNEFKYLGFVFGSSGKFSKGIHCLADQGSRALFSLKAILQKYPEVMPYTQLNLFKAMVCPVLSYACELWGFCEADQLERLYLGFMKSILCVKKSTPSVCIYREFQTTTLKCDRLIRIVKFWLKILKLGSNKPLRKIYNLLLNDAQENKSINWVSLVRDLLTSKGFGTVWLDQCVDNEKFFLSQFSQRIKDNFLQYCDEQIRNLSDHRLFKHIYKERLTLDISNYLTVIKDKYLRTAIARFRLGSHSFMLERGKWFTPKLDFSDRICEICRAVEDEYHIVIECKRFNVLRDKYIPRKLLDRLSMFKFCNFF